MALVLFASSAGAVGLVDYNNLGTDFWFAVPHAVSGGFIYAGESLMARVEILAPTGATGSMDIPGLGLSTPFNLAANGWVDLSVSPTAMGQMDATDHAPAIANTAIHIVSDRPVSAMLTVAPGADDDATILYPTSSLGLDYYNLSYGYTGEPCSAITATQDNTTLQVLPSASFPPYVAGVTVTATLNKGQWYFFFAPAFGSLPPYGEFSGSLFTADKPVSVLCSNMGTFIPLTAMAADILLEQELPVSDWGSQFVAVTFAPRTNGDFIRVLASQANTSVRVNGALQQVIQPGVVDEFQITSHALIQSDQPVLVAHFMASLQYDTPNTNGDPALEYLPPVPSWPQAYAFVTAQSSSPYQDYYVNIAVPSGGTGSVSVDGVPLPASAFSPAGAGFAGAQWPITFGQHHVTCGGPCQVTHYGETPYASYATLAGWDVQPTPTDSPTVAPSPTLTPSSSASPTSTASPSATPTPTASPSITVTPSATPTLTPPPSPTCTPSRTPTPRPLALSPGYPNPDPVWEGNVWLPYTLTEDATVNIEVFDVAGERVRRWEAGWRLEGTHEEAWDLRNDAGATVASGTYLCLIKADSNRGEHAQVWEKCAVLR